MPFKPKYTITPKINKGLVEIERVRGFLDAIKLKDDWFLDMQKKLIHMKGELKSAYYMLLSPALKI